MSDHVADNIVLAGAGDMAVAYANVLLSMGMTPAVIGRGQQSAARFEQQTGIRPVTGGLERWLEQANWIPDSAIVAVPVELLAQSTLLLLRHGVKRLLIEKPGGLNGGELEKVRLEAQKRQAEVYVAYNRRFYASTQKALRLIEEDGGVISFQFEFTEWSHLIAGAAKAAEVKKMWFLANSTHVVDLAFFLGGAPSKISCFTSGGLPWHPAASIFSGAGSTENGALFSYHANWVAPGRWGVELMTRKRRLIMRPLEQLHVQHIGSIVAEQVPLEDELDRKYKPGIYLQVEAFLQHPGNPSLVAIEDQCGQWARIFAPIVNPGEE